MASTTPVLIFPRASLEQSAITAQRQRANKASLALARGSSTINNLTSRLLRATDFNNTQTPTGANIQSVPAVADVDGAGGVSRHVFDLNLLAFTLAHDFGAHGGVGNQGLADLNGVAVRHQQDLVQDHFVAALARKALHPEHVPGGDAVLFPAGFNNGVHFGLQKNTNFRQSSLSDFRTLST